MVEERPRKKKNRHNPLLDWLIYLAVRMLIVFMSLFHVETNLRFARFGGRFMWRHYHRGRQRALENLRASFPDKSEDWIWQTGVRSFENLVMLMVDILFAPRLVTKDNWRHYSRFVNAERIKWMMKEGKGLLVVQAHYGNFEIGGYMMGLFGFEAYGVARPLDNKYLNRYLYGLRQRRGLKLIDKKGAAGLMPEIARTGGTLGFIADQDAGKKGIFVDFFGRKASTYKSVGLLAILYNVPVVVGSCRRVDNRFFYEFKPTRLILPQEWADKEDPLLWITAEYTKGLEQAVREDPTQYWWLHRRWKTRPKGEDAQDGKIRIPIIKRSPYARVESGM